MDYKKFNSSFFLVILILFGSFLRIYNINYDDLWSDEMISFWNSDPTIGFRETIDRIFSSQLMVSYEIFLKFFHYIFGYDVHISRYFSSIVSILSLILFCVLIKKNSSKNSMFFGLLLLVINIYHIKYSLELRSYILSFLLAIFLINQIFNNQKLKEFFSFYDYIFIFFISLILLFSHAFSIILIFSLFIYLCLKFIRSPSDKNFEKYIIFTLFLSCSLFLYIYLNNISHYPDWVEQVKPTFYTNFYFSKFFGSRFLGLIYLITLIYLMIKFRNKLIKNLDIYTFLLILILSSYFFPLIFGYLVKPILVDRYIFFVIVPLILLTSHFIFLIKNKILKYLLVIIIPLLTLLNHFFEEYTFRQLYTDIHPTKPQIKKTLNTINSSNVKKFTFKMDDKNKQNINSVRINYLKKYNDKLNFEIQLFEYLDKEKNPDIFWMIYFTDITDEKFAVPEKFEEYVVSKIKKFNRIELYLLKKP